jgi:LmbE family N-acetylglucosaminyl deacetylase
MKILKSIALIFVMLGTFAAVNGQKVDPNKKLHIIIIGAHPDDPDEVGGTAYKWAQAGHDVLMVSLTNGDAGHQTMDSETLAKVRREEARRAGEVIGVRYITLDNHDGQLMPTYENRLQVIKINPGTKS